MRYKYLAIADPAGLRGLADRLDRGCQAVVGNDDFDFHLRKKIDHIFRPAIELGVTLLAAEAFRLGHGDTLDASLLEGLFHLVELERLYDRFNLFHCAPPRSGCSRWQITCKARSRQPRIVLESQ